MAVDSKGEISSASEGGIIGEHAVPAIRPYLVGATTSDEFNTLQFPLRPIFCWKVEDVRFAFDSSFVSYNLAGAPDPQTNPDDATTDPEAMPFSRKEDIRDELEIFANQVSANPGCPLSVWGHADPVGPAIDPDGYNKALSGRRATSIYALLTSGTQLQTSVGLWQQIASHEQWGDSQKNVMQQATSLPAGTSMDRLIAAYLPKLCPPELLLKPTDFLAQGAGSGGKGDYQGCSSFNSLIIFSQTKQDSFAAGKNDQDPAVYAARNLANAPNRRVMVLAFPKGSKVDPAKWPCPSVQGDKSGCIKRFWSDGDARRGKRLPDIDRRFDDTQDTFACRFYQRLAETSPCESQRTYNFFYGLQMTQNLPWSTAAKLTVISEDGTQKQVFTMDQGVRSGDVLYFQFRFIRPGIRYRARVADGRVILKLFPYTELYRITDPTDPLHAIPMLPADQINPQLLATSDPPESA